MTASPPPGPKGSLILGNLTEFRRDLPNLLLRIARDYGPMSKVRIGPTRMVLVNDPELVHRLLVTDAAKFHKSRRTGKLIIPHLGNGLLTLEGAEHRRHRRLMQPALHTRQIARYGQIMVDESVRRLASWPDGEPQELVAEMADLTLRIVAAALFRIDESERGAELISAVHDFAYSLNLGLRGAALLPGWLPVRANRHRWATLRRIDALAYDLIAQRRAAGGDGGDLLSMLVQARDADGSDRLTDREIRNELMTMFFAGHETSAAALVWAFYLLARHPEVAERTRAELAEVLAGRLPTMADLPALPYLRQVISETLRLYPPGWLFDREPVADMEIGGYLIRRGTILMFSPWVVHRDPRWWDEPDQFRPERFAPGVEIPREAYAPFGDGPRMCVGNRFAEAEIGLVLATMLPRVRLDLPPGQEEVAVAGEATIRPRGGLRLTVHHLAATPTPTPAPAN